MSPEPPASKTRLTPTGVKLILGAVALASTGWVLGVGEAFAGAAALLAVLIHSATRSGLWTPLLQVERRVTPEFVSVGDDCSVRLLVLNRSRRDSSPVRLEDHLAGTGIATISIPPLGPAQHESVTFRLPTEARGVFALGPCSYSLLDPFRLVNRKVQACGSATVTVWPMTWDLALPAPGRAVDDTNYRSEWISRRPSIGEFSSLAEYVPGDDRRHIHWPSTARANKLLVRRFELPGPSTTFVLLDTSCASLGGFEVAVSMAASLLSSIDSPEVSPALTIIHADGTVQAESHSATRMTRTQRLNLALDQLAEVEGSPTGESDGSREIGAISAAIRKLGIRIGDRVLIVRCAPEETHSGRAAGDDLRSSVPDHVSLALIDVPPSASPSSMDQTKAQAILDRAVQRSTKFTTTGL
ncbi:MAG: DUF58 domain-containing protein [Microthrixaceae bacterium]|nr:DUF58 domain-containing protein [Microthrixaceae bacterium]